MVSQVFPPALFATPTVHLPHFESKAALFLAVHLDKQELYSLLLFTCFFPLGGVTFSGVTNTDMLPTIIINCEVELHFGGHKMHDVRENVAL